MSTPLWTPSPERIAASNMQAFAAFVRDQVDGQGADALHRWSIKDPEAFWSAVWDFTGIIGDKGARPWLVDAHKMPGARFFPNARLNYAQNILKHADGDAQQIVFAGEDGTRRTMTGRELLDAVARFQRYLQSCGIKQGDRVGGVLPNVPEAIAAMLAATSIGAVWSSCSPDFGEQGILDRFGQIAPKIIITSPGYNYAGKIIDVAPKIEGLCAKLPSLTHAIVLPFVGDADALCNRLHDVRSGLSVTTWAKALAQGGPGKPLFSPLPFDHPLFILYSSGTTGAPKCIVHAAGGVLIKHMSEQVIHSDIKPGDRMFYFTTLGWMMWNWLVSGLAAGADLVLYDGSPTHPDMGALWRMAERERCTLFGTSAKYIDTLKKTDFRPKDSFDLSAMRTVMSTGSPLSAEGFDHIYDAVKNDVHLASISGGTDICGCFVLGDVTRPVWRGEIQAPALGVATDVADDTGASITEGKGELVCRNALPSFPIEFWNDEDGARYRAAYFERFPGLWHHGDFAEWTPHGGMIIHGRSDATLNPGGVRIGTAEIYRVVENIAEIQEAIAVGQEVGGDVRVLLFVVMRQGKALSEELIQTIKARIRAGASPRHVPALVCAVPDIPRTRSGKISELAVRDVVMGRSVKNTEALANPEALDVFRDGPWSIPAPAAP